jgi:hypothetical protein
VAVVPRSCTSLPVTCVPGLFTGVRQSVTRPAVPCMPIGTPRSITALHFAALNIHFFRKREQAHATQQFRLQQGFCFSRCRQWPLLGCLGRVAEAAAAGAAHRGLGRGAEEIREVAAGGGEVAGGAARAGDGAPRLRRRSRKTSSTRGSAWPSCRSDTSGGRRP